VKRLNQWLHLLCVRTSNHGVSDIQDEIEVVGESRYWHLADIGLCAAHVRFWHKADISLCAAHVRLRG